MAGIGRCDTLEALLASCDVVSLNCDLNADNHHLLNGTTLSHIPQGKGVRLSSFPRMAVRACWLLDPHPRAPSRRCSS
jgi:hypothetical protein